MNRIYVKFWYRNKDLLYDHKKSAPITFGNCGCWKSEDKNKERDRITQICLKRNRLK